MEKMTHWNKPIRTQQFQMWSFWHLRNFHNHRFPFNWGSTWEATSLCAGLQWQEDTALRSVTCLLGSPTSTRTALSGRAEMGSSTAGQPSLVTRSRGTGREAGVPEMRPALRRRAAKAVPGWQMCLHMEAAQSLCTGNDLSVHLHLGKEEAATTC